jgi:hypothetical protein
LFCQNGATKIEALKRSIKGCSVRFPDCKEPFPGLTSIAAEREYADVGFDDSWQVNGTVLLRLMNAIGQP